MICIPPPSAGCAPSRHRWLLKISIQVYENAGSTLATIFLGCCMHLYIIYLVKATSGSLSTYYKTCNCKKKRIVSFVIFGSRKCHFLLVTKNSSENYKVYKGMWIITCVSHHCWRGCSFLRTYLSLCSMAGVWDTNGIAHAHWVRSGLSLLWHISVGHLCARCGRFSRTFSKVEESEDFRRDEGFIRGWGLQVAVGYLVVPTLLDFTLEHDMEDVANMVWLCVICEYKLLIHTSCAKFTACQWTWNVHSKSLPCQTERYIGSRSPHMTARTLGHRLPSTSILFMFDITQSWPKSQHSTLSWGSNFLRERDIGLDTT